MKNAKLKKTAVIVYAAVCVSFLSFFVYMGLFENVSVQNNRLLDTASRTEKVTAEEIADPSAPIGIRRQYQWTLRDLKENDSVLAFYLVHHYAEVYFDGELVYSLMPLDTNRIGESISSNWVIIPVYPEDNGTEVRVVATPVYESVRSRKIEFLILPIHTLYLTQLRADLPQLILGGICIVMGIVVTLAEPVLIWRKKTRNWSVFFLGNFLLLLGIWKITDTRFSPLMFPGNTMLLGYLAIGVIFFACIPFSLYLYLQSSKFKPARMLIVSLVISGLSLIALFCQIAGIADFKQTLLLAQIAILLMILTLFTPAFFRGVHGNVFDSKWSWVFVLMLGVGAAIDFLMFYIRDSSSGLVFSIFAILIYTLALFVSSIQDINKQANTDTHTGLFNKRRWDILMDDPTSATGSVSVMMMDLNGLKYINDTMGHEAGDQMIFHFANILRNTIPPSNIICRWGGDEFTVMLTNADRERTEKYIENIRSAVEDYNTSGGSPALSFAVGYALSDDYPGLSRKELLEKADELMYQNKKVWYQQQNLP